MISFSRSGKDLKTSLPKPREIGVNMVWFSCHDAGLISNLERFHSILGHLFGLLWFSCHDAGCRINFKSRKA